MTSTSQSSGTLQQQDLFNNYFFWSALRSTEAIGMYRRLELKSSTQVFVSCPPSLRASVDIMHIADVQIIIIWKICASLPGLKPQCLWTPYCWPFPRPATSGQALPSHLPNTKWIWLLPVFPLCSVLIQALRPLAHTLVTFWNSNIIMKWTGQGLHWDPKGSADGPCKCSHWRTPSCILSVCGSILVTFHKAKTHSILVCSVHCICFVSFRAIRSALQTQVWAF